ncbi:MAG: hypothetical protein QOE69_197 [Thermoleophilaceae bacterium]|nr:hypothetical protein [Thermoleophilaceae bacterium]
MTAAGQRGSASGSRWPSTWRAASGQASVMMLAVVAVVCAGALVLSPSATRSAPGGSTSAPPIWRR